MEEEEKVRFDIDEMIDYDNVEEEIKTAVASVELNVYVNCPYCDELNEILNECQDRLTISDNLSCDECELEITCDNANCKKDFIVTQINY